MTDRLMLFCDIMNHFGMAFGSIPALVNYGFTEKL